MSYHADKPFGRRKTDKPLSPNRRRELQMIRRDVDEDSTGTIRRYLRLAAKVLAPEEPDDAETSPQPPLSSSKNRAA